MRGALSKAVSGFFPQSMRKSLILRTFQDKKTKSKQTSVKRNMPARLGGGESQSLVV